MKRIIGGAILLSLFIFVANLPGAVIKWEQPPNCVDGFNVDSFHDPTNFIVVADDFLCNDPRPISHIRWWGSFKGWMETFPGEVEPPSPDYLPVSFDISWHEYTHPAGEYSQPADTLQVNLCDDFITIHYALLYFVH